MAQLNPNFEIDFNDINSYEQIQLINDTQLAKENLLMHRPYKEPSDDEIIRNQFSSFTFVDFCPKLFSVKQPSTSTTSGASNHLRTQETTSSTTPKVCSESCNRLSLKCYELESFSDLFERINTWLKLNKDWRVVSMQTLVYDCTSQFNHQKSSIYSKYLPQNTRGLRLFLSPSKSRFSGPQKIGCINVVPRKVSGSYMKPEEPPVYETLDEILNRLNELLLTRPIEGRILSVETLTLPMVNGYVNTETNYFIDSRLNSLYDSTYIVGADSKGDSSQSQHQQPSTGSSTKLREQKLIDILRVYYEFGPLVCGLVNLIDFVPRFYSSKQPFETSTSDSANEVTSPSTSTRDHESENLMPKPVPKIAATESLTRLIRRSLAWFESERKGILNDKKAGDSAEAGSDAISMGSSNRAINLKVCNLQVHHKTLLKSQLLQVTPTNAIEMANTRMMVHERTDLKSPIVCGQCSISSVNVQRQDWCSHLLELTQPYNLKFVRLAYIIPVFNNYITRPPRPMRLHKLIPESPRRKTTISITNEPYASSYTEPRGSGGQLIPDFSSSSSAHSSEPTTPNPELQEPEISSENSDEHNQEQQQKVETDLLEAYEDEARQVASTILRGTNERHRTNELAHQLQQLDDGLNDSLIGQLTYRLFAPCQLVSSSSCFSINPVNSSSPLARRGSVDINGSGISSENAHPSTSLLGPGSSSSLLSGEPQQVVTSFGAFFPALSHEVITGASTQSSATSGIGNVSGNGSRFTNNEFEPVDAIKRRMEVYVTTNSMKVIAGETLIVHLSDALSCLSTAIEQTVVRANFACSKANTWVSVYVLYAAVEEPQLPVQLLAQQKLRELSLIDEGDGNEEEEAMKEKLLEGRTNCIFDDDFKGSLTDSGQQKKASNLQEPSSSETQQPSTSALISAESFAETSNSSIRVEQNPANSSLTLYNSAYDRTVALPSPPENYSSGSVDPAEYLGNDGVWIDEDPFSDKVVHMPDMEARKKRRKKAKKRNRHDDSQCSIM